MHRPTPLLPFSWTGRSLPFSFAYLTKVYAYRCTGPLHSSLSWTGRSLPFSFAYLTKVYAYWCTGPLHSSLSWTGRSLPFSFAYLTKVHACQCTGPLHSSLFHELVGANHRVTSPLQGKTSWGIRDLFCCDRAWFCHLLSTILHNSDRNNENSIQVQSNTYHQHSEWRWWSLHHRCSLGPACRCQNPCLWTESKTWVLRIRTAPRVLMLTSKRFGFYNYDTSYHCVVLCLRSWVHLEFNQCERQPGFHIPRKTDLLKCTSMCTHTHTCTHHTPTQAYMHMNTNTHMHPPTHPTPHTHTHTHTVASIRMHTCHPCTHCVPKILPLTLWLSPIPSLPLFPKPNF